MTFSKINVLGWATGERLTSAQMNALDDRWASVADFGAGGTWAPSGQVILGGSGLRVTGPSRFDACSILVATSITATGLAVGALPTLSSPATVKRVQPLAPVFSTNWAFESTTMTWDQSVVSNTIKFPISNVPDNSTLTEAIAYVSGPSAGA